jgi:alanine racemase
MSEIDGRVSRLTVDLAAIQRNYRRLVTELRPGAECAAVVKANAYGLGVAPVAQALAAAGARRFFVAQFDEGLQLRPLLPRAQIFVLNGLQPGLETYFDSGKLIPVLNSLGEVALWTEHAHSIGRALPAAIHLDTGMSRLGLPRGEVEILIAEPQRLHGLQLVLLMSHLACSDDPEHEANHGQLALFENWRRRLPAAPASFANSCGIFLGPDYQFDMVRPGAALYGVNPLRNLSNPMEQVIVVEGKILQVRGVDRGTTVGYGATHRIESPAARLATVAIGYADGYLRSSSGRGLAYVGERLVRVVGRVSMDLITIDVSELPADAAHPGDWVELIGPHLPVDEVAERAGTIGYEILTSLGRRYARQYIRPDG